MSLDKTADSVDDTGGFERQADPACEADTAPAAGLMTPVRRAALEALEREFRDLFAPPAR